MSRRTWFHATQPRRSRIVVGGALVGAMAMTGALVAGPSVPGAKGGAWVNYRSWGGGSEANLLSAPPPILSIRDKLTLGPVQELFTVEALHAAYWRVIALDWFTDDNAWGINKATEQSASKLTFPNDLPPSTTLAQHFHITQLDPHWLPAAYRPVSINLNAAEVVPDSLTLLLDSKTDIDTLAYDVQSQVPTPSQTLLRQARFSDPTLMARDLELPRDFPASVRTLAQQVTAEAQGPYGYAVALERFFRETGHFTYTVHTRLGDSPDAIVEFLRTREGFCEQFAAAFAAMARSVGLPARVAVGYQPGTLARDGRFHVTNRDAHAWPEVWIDGAGWIPFEPTPAFKEPTLGLGTGGPSPRGGGGPAVTTTTGVNTTTSGPGQSPTTRPRGLGGAVSVQQPTARASSHRTLRSFLAIVAIALAAALLGVLVFFAVASITLWERTRHRRHDRDPRRRVLGAWSEALDLLATAGVPPRPTATALEFALRHAPAHGAGDAGPPLMELARLQSAAMFAPEPPSAGDATLAWQHVDAIRAAVRRAVASSTRWRRRLRRR